jgi:hypothetical protein
MSTRQHRLNSIEQISRKFSEIKGKKVNIILNDRTVIFGKMQAIEGEIAKVLNMRLKEVRIPLNMITEIYYDTKE